MQICCIGTILNRGDAEIAEIAEMSLIEDFYDWYDFRVVGNESGWVCKLFCMSWLEK